MVHFNVCAACFLAQTAVSVTPEQHLSSCGIIEWHFGSLTFCGSLVPRTCDPVSAGLSCVALPAFAKRSSEARMVPYIRSTNIETRNPKQIQNPNFQRLKSKAMFRHSLSNVQFFFHFVK
jgi:hypothetical protein